MVEVETEGGRERIQRDKASAGILEDMHGDQRSMGLALGQGWMEEVYNREPLVGALVSHKGQVCKNMGSGCTDHLWFHFLMSLPWISQVLPEVVPFGLHFQMALA